MTLKVAIIGPGGVSEAHLSAYPEVEDIKIVAAAEPRKQRLDEVCARGSATVQSLISPVWGIFQVRHRQRNMCI